MKKEFAVGDWFPTKTRAIVVDNSIDRADETLRTGGGNFGFQVLYVGDNKYKVIGSSINSFFLDTQEFTLSNTSTKRIWVAINFSIDGVVTGANFTTSEPEDTTDIFGSLIVATIYSGNIVQTLRGAYNAISAGVKKEYFRV
jgi:hypothetical protein